MTDIDAYIGPRPGFYIQPIMTYDASDSFDRDFVVDISYVIPQDPFKKDMIQLTLDYYFDPPEFGLDAYKYSAFVAMYLEPKGNVDESVGDLMEYVECMVYRQ